MSLKALQDYTFTAKYARWRKDLGRRETYDEATDRVKDMHLRRYPRATSDIEWAFELVKQKRVLGSQRALQFGGEPIERKNMRVYNCVVSYCDRPRFFAECLWLLLCGCGAGFSVQKHHVEKLPRIYQPEDPAKSKDTYLVEDTIEGWANALDTIINLFMTPGSRIPYFDFSQIRPQGAPLSTGGKAPGPKPLENAIGKIIKVCQRAADHGDRLQPIDCYDIIMHASDAVLAGGIRRSATICVFSPDDIEMATAKTGDWFNENPQRGRSNNSAMLVRGETTKEQFTTLMESVREFGEPGFIWSDSTELLVNPCVEIGMYPVCTQTGESGWQACNLCEINGRLCTDKEAFFSACAAASIIGTLQAGYTDVGYLTDASRRILEREALLGVSITGIMDNPDVLLNPGILRGGAAVVRDTNERMATKIGINSSARTTCIKPAGSTSCMLGTASGIHPHHARRYIRRAQTNRLEAPGLFYQHMNPAAVEESVWSANNTDMVISFPVEVPKGAIVKNNMNAIDLLESVKLVQQNWVMPGRNPELCTQPWLSHNVSNTITVHPDEWDAVANFIYNNRRFFCGISLLPSSGDKDYPQAPFLAVHTPQEIVRLYGDASVLASGLIVDGLHMFDNNLWQAIDYLLIEGKINELTSSHQKDWCRRLQQFADRYFDGNARQASYCLKDVSTWHTWCELRREYRPVNYREMKEDDDQTKVEQTIACAGGSCDTEYA